MSDRPPSPAPDAPSQVLDTSKMSSGERAAMELAEASRDRSKGLRSFGASIFMGSPDFAQLLPFPSQSEEDKKEGDAFLATLEAYLKEHTDPDAIDREGEIPDEVFRGLGELGAFGIKIPKEYSGLGLSQTNYSRAAMLLGGHCGNLTALLSAHQSIGVPQPLIVFGTEEQKQRWLPRCAKGEVSAFALTEPDVGSDPARMSTTATPTGDGTAFLINGEKLWCTNGVKAGCLVVMAKTPPPPGAPESHRAITAFIVDRDSPGVEVTHRCRFMGLKALYNGVMRFTNVRVPRENIVLGEGRGLKVALTTLNTGRLTLPAACVGLGRKCLEHATKWAARRVQWGQEIGKHDAIAQKLAGIAADTATTEAMVRFTSSLVDRDKKADIRIEAAFAKLWGTERGWAMVDDTMQIRGGRGFETSDSLKARGEEGVPIERFMRDSRINTIFEGSTEIMHLFIAREALDPHLQLGGPVLNSQLPGGVRFKAALKSALFYAWWYPRQWLPILTSGVPGGVTVHPRLKRELRRARRLSHRLARGLFHAMIRFGPKLDKKQAVLGRFVDAGAEIFGMTTLVGHTQQQLDTESDDGKREALLDLATYACRRAALKAEELLRGTTRNADSDGYGVARKLLVDEK